MATFLTQPLIPVLLAYAAGIAAAHFSAEVQISTKHCIMASCIFFIAAAAAFYKKSYSAAAACICCLLFIAGFCRLHHKIHPDPVHNTVSNYIDAGPVTMAAVVTEPAAETRYRTRLKLALRSIQNQASCIPVTGNLLLSIKEARSRFSCGDRILFTAGIRRPQNFNNPGGFDYVRHLARREIYATAFLDTDSSITRLGGQEAAVWLLATERLRSRIRDCIRKSVEPPARDIVLALVIGEQATIPDDIRSRFSALGITHILSISGLHVSIFALLTYWLIYTSCKMYPRMLLYVPAKKIAVALSIFPVMGYCMIAGLATPAVRSGLMVACYLATLLLDRPQHMLHTLFVAALGILALSPQSLFEISFQLSFLAVFCLIVLVPAWKNALPGKDPDPLAAKSPIRARFAAYTIDSLLTSAAAMLGTAPLVAWYFYTFAPSGLITNLIMVPITGFILVPLGLVSALCIFICQPLALLLFKITGACTAMFLSVSELLHLALGDGLTITKPLLWEIVFFYVLLFSSVLCRTKKHWAALAAGCLVFLSAEVLQTAYDKSPGSLLSVTFLDVGAGDAAVIRLPDKKVMLIDGGGLMDDSFDIGKAVVAPYLYTCGLKTVDFIVMTHPHQDHAGGLPYIARHFRMREFWHNGSSLNFDAFRSLQTMAEDTNVRVHACAASTPRRMLGPVAVDYFNPRTTGTQDPENANNDSLVLKLSYGDISFLFTADILKRAEAELAASGKNLAATILKAPHHGGRTSSTEAFLTAVHPSVAVISGRSYGKRRTPHPEVEKRLQDLNITRLTTEHCGAITVVTDGKDFKISTFKEPQGL